MTPTVARDPDLEPVPIAPPPQGKPDDPVPGDDPYSGPQYSPEVDKSVLLAQLSDAEDREANWRKLGREIVEIYRNESAKAASGKLPNGGSTFNILYSNTEVMLPAVYQKPPQPVVRSRFTSVPAPMQPPPMPIPPGMVGAGPMGPGLPPAGPPEGGPPPGLGGPPSPPGLGGPPPMPMPQPGMLSGGIQPAGMAPGGLTPPPMIGAGVPPPGSDIVGPMAPGGPGAPIQLPPELGQAPPPFGMAPGQPAPPMPTLPTAAPGRPEQSDIETAASVMEKALEIVLDDENGDEAIKTAIKDVLLPGRGTCRVRWKPQMQQRPVMAGDGMTPLPGGAVPGAEAPMEEIKVWETVNDEYVYWEDLLVDPVRQAADTEWIAFRHLFTKEAMEAEFAGSPEYEKLKADNKLGELFRWTEESAAKQPVGGGGALRSADKLGAQIFKCMVWEIWDRAQRRVIWFVRDYLGLVLRVDGDTLQLAGFYPCPVPMLAVTTSDSRIPRPFYEMYRKLAQDLEDTSARISRLTKQLKHVALYNGASKEIGQLLLAEDGKMIAVPGVDMIAAGGLANHIWVKPILEIMQTLKELYLAREQIKMAIYEVMGISDIMRGSTNANETATAQRIKGSMGVNRMNDTKKIADNFVRDLLRLKGEIIAQNFDAETLAKMTGEEVTPAVMAILRSDFQRTCGIDIETDSTVVPDLMAEQEAMAQTMTAITSVMAAIGPLLQSGILPPAQVVQLALELLKLAIHPIRYSRGVMELIQGFQDQLEAQIAMQAMLPPAPPPMPPPQGAGQRTGPPGTPSPPPPGGPAPKSNGAAPSMPPPPMLGA